jgi:hypothetical protein
MSREEESLRSRKILSSCGWSADKEESKDPETENKILAQSCNL